jgi:type II secretory pathway pseudopilin PulG
MRQRNQSSPVAPRQDCRTSLGILLIAGLKRRLAFGLPVAERQGYTTRRAFTLVEMLIAVGITVMMMTLFAEIFQLASNSMTKQRGLSENDQRSRSFITIIKADLDKRTFRYVMPFAANENLIAGGLAIPTTQRQGYFYISENDPANDTDDVLQFTVRTTVRIKNRDDTAYFGHAVPLLPMFVVDQNSDNQLTNADDVTGDGVFDGADFGAHLFAHPNQSETDDGQINIDFTASSSAAEISLFFRNGNLYRRVLLVREPLPLSGSDSRPSLANGAQLFDLDPDNNGATATPAFVYPDAAQAQYRAAPASPQIPNRFHSGNFWNDFDFSAFADTSGGVFHGARFHGISSLANEVPGGGFFPLGNPAFRFGHNHVNTQPREYSGTTAAPGPFLGRFTHEETSNAAFGYPHSITTNPMNMATSVLIGANGAVTSYAAGPRAGEDLLLGHVQSFDVKVWDDGYNEDANANGTLDAGEDQNGNGIFEIAGAFVDVGHPYTVGDYRGGPTNPPTPPYRNRYASGGAFSYGPASVATSNRVFDTWHPQINLDGDTAGMPPLPIYDEPPFRPAPTTGRDGQPGKARVDDDNDGATDNATELGWWGSDDLHPLRAVQITVRFLDVSSNQIRQVTFVHSLVD